MTQERISLCPFKAQFATEGFLIKPTQEELEQRYTANAALEKIDLYTHLIPAVDRVVQAMMQTHPQPPGHITQFESLEAQASSGLKRAINDYVRSQDENDILSALAHRKEGAPGLKALLKRGATTATGAMHKMLRRIPVAYKEKYGTFSESAAEVTAIARKNYPFLRLSARQHVGELEIQQNMGNIRKADHFTTFMSYAVLDERDMLTVHPDIHTKFPHLFDENGHVLSQDHATPELWCPALYSKALYSLWNWHLTGAERIYTEQIRERGSQVVVFPRVESISAD